VFRDARGRAEVRRIIGYRDLAKLAVVIERDFAGTTVPSLTGAIRNHRCGRRRPPPVTWEELIEAV
jgi:hypothetical protein